MKYNYREIEAKWQKIWKEKKTFRTENGGNKLKYYVLDMFPYPSGAGLHVGHPLGYIASDIFARYKKLKGFNVLHPMGFDSFGLPAEQYAIQTGQHPRITTETNIARYREQLESIGFSFDWDREIRTSDPSYYKWTQVIFLQLFHSWYDHNAEKARPISELISHFETKGNRELNAATSFEDSFTSADWKGYSEKQKSDLLMAYRLTYLADTMVNWCPALGTVLANDEVIAGLSERGGYPVVQKKMRQWMMRITAYAGRLEKGLEGLDWSESLKEIQRNWIGRSEGARVAFELEGSKEKLEVFTTRPDTIFGVSFMVLAPEHPLVPVITTAQQKQAVEAYLEKTANRSERERMAEVKTVTGEFTGAHVVHPFTGKKIPVWVADYVLIGYGTGAIMGVPSGDERDWHFARTFSLTIEPVIEGSNVEEGANDSKDGTLINSDFLNGLKVKEAISKAISRLEEMGIGEKRINFRMRDAVFSRQRYWGEPIPIYYKDDIAYPMTEDQLPLQLPEVDKYLPTESGEPPLARAKSWKTAEGYPIETNTMPGWAGSSWYLFRYMDPNNDQLPFSKEAIAYWKHVDFYVGGAEHATGHLLYARFWTKFLKDIGWVNVEEPFHKMLNQGMIQGKSALIYRFNVGHINKETGEIESKETNLFLSKHIADKLNNGDLTPKDLEHMIDAQHGKGFAHKNGLVSNFMDSPKPTRIHVDVGLVDGEELQVVSLKKWQPRFEEAIFLSEEDERFITATEVEKMSKTKFNVINPDDLIDKFGADTLRCYEMFLGPVEQHKPWDTHGIEGVHRFLRRFWTLFHPQESFEISNEPAPAEAMKALHKFLKKVVDDIERLSFNTVVSECMILSNKLIELKCNHREVLEPFTIALSPYAPHLTEEIWEKLGHTSSISTATFPEFNEKYLVEDSVKYPVSFNGKVRFTLEMPTAASKEEVEAAALSDDQSAKWLEGKTPKKVIVVPGKIINIVI